VAQALCARHGFRFRVTGHVATSSHATGWRECSNPEARRAPQAQADDLQKPAACDGQGRGRFEGDGRGGERRTRSAASRPQRAGRAPVLGAEARPRRGELPRLGLTTVRMQSRLLIGDVRAGREAVLPGRNRPQDGALGGRAIGPISEDNGGALRKACSGCGSILGYALCILDCRFGRQP
jgi:hypothetical protein